MTTLEHFSIAYGDGDLQATVYEPTGPCDGTAILSHGFGSNRIEGGLFPRLGRALAQAGVRSIAFDRLGQGESAGDFENLSVEDEIRQVVAVIDHMRSQRSHPLHLIGMSMGAVLSACAAARRPSSVTSLTLLSPAAVFADEIASGTLQGRSTDTTGPGYFDFMGSKLGAPFLAEAATFDPYREADGFRGNVRIVHGDQDIIVPVRYAERYLDVYGDQAHLTIVRDADHGFATVPHRDLVVAQITQFIQGNGRAAGA